MRSCGGVDEQERRDGQGERRRRAAEPSLRRSLRSRSGQGTTHGPQRRMRTRRVGSPTRAQALSIAAAFMLASALGLVQLSLVARWLTPAMNAEFLALWGLIFA